MFLSRLSKFLLLALLPTVLHATVLFVKPINMKATVNVPFNQNLVDLLADKGVPPYQFFSNNLPNFLKIQGYHLVGTPPQVGTFHFNLSVRDSTPEGVDFNEPATLVVLPPPPQFKVGDINLGNQKEDFAWADNVKNYLVDPSLATSFEATGLPSWMEFNSNTGALSGTPKRVNVGPYQGITFTAKGAGGSAIASAHGVVLKTIHPPKWISQNNTFGDGLEDQIFSQETMPLISKGDGVIFQFSMTGAPSWLEIDSATGRLSGTPHTFGAYSFTITFSSFIDGQTFSDTAKFSFNIIHVNHAPIWSQINVPAAFTGIYYIQALGGFASDPDVGDTLSYAISGPNWGKIHATTGEFSGTPVKANIGPNTFQVTVTDHSGASATTTFVVTVIKSNEPPVWLSKPTVLPDAKEDFSYFFTLSHAAMDPDKDPMFFTILSGPAWATINNQGILQGIPGAADVGLSKFQIKVSDRIAVPDDVTEVQIFVSHTNHAPTWTLNPIINSTPEESLYTENLAIFAKDIDPGDTLTFQLISGPAWGNLTAAGVFSGTPQMVDEGENKFVVRVADNWGLVADATLFVNVLHINHAPVWSQNPIILPNANDDGAYSTSVAMFASDVDPGDLLKFSKLDAAPAWLSLDANGKITGRPTPADVGTFSFRAQVADLANATAIANVKITVEHVNHAPQWTPITVPAAYTGVFYSQALAGFTSDPDVGDVLTFTVSGPAWGKIDLKTGVFSGTPAKANIGNNTFQVTVTDNFGSSAVTTMGINVIKSNEPPEWVSDNIQLPKVQEDAAYILPLWEYASDPDNDPIFFTIISGPSWARVDEKGHLTGVPGAVNVGINTFQIKVSDHIASPDDVAELKVNVEHVNHPPTWTQNPIVLPHGYTSVGYSNTVFSFAKDPDGDKLTFSFQGPSWASLDPDTGVLSGVPSKADLGENRWQAVVKDPSGATASTTIKVTVIKSNEPPVWTQHPTILNHASEDSLYDVNLSSYAKDPDNDPIFFTKVDGPVWATVNSFGHLVGSPGAAEVGLHKFHLKVSDHIASPDDVAEVQVLVLHVNHSPYWVMNPLFFTTPEDSLFSVSLAPFAKDPDKGDTLSFALLNGPSWATLASDGTLSGTPTMANEGENNFNIAVRDNSGASANVRVIVKVTHVNHAPYWTQEIILPDANDLDPYASNVAEFAKDPDPNDTLTISRSTSTPAWMTVHPDGKITGIPAYKDVGTSHFKIKVTDAGNLSAEVNVQIKVQHVNRPPKWTANPLVLVDAIAKKNYSNNVSTSVSDPDANESFTFKMTGPAWATLDPKTGVISGTPGLADIGENIWEATVSDAVGASDTTLIKINVKKINEPPHWLAHPTLLPKAQEDDAFMISLKTLALDPDGDALYFTLISGPSWATLTSDGYLMGTLGADSVGLNKFRVTVSDHIALPDDTTEIQLFVEHTNHSPYWVMNPIFLSADEGVAWTATIAAYAKDPDTGDKLNFTLVSGPAWAKLATDGTFTGTPSASEVGLNQFVVQVYDNNGLTANTIVKVNVRPADHPPVISPDLPKFVVKERENRMEDLKQWVKDPDGDLLTFVLFDTRPWVSLSSNGQLTMKPKRPDLGAYALRFSVSAGGKSVQGVLNIEVVKDPQPPQWNTNPIALLEAKSNEPFAASVRDRASDPNGEALTFFKKSGPSWLVVSNLAGLSGVPLDSDVGKNNFIFSVCNESQLCADGTLIVQVLGGVPVIDVVQVDTPVVGAASENLWVVDAQVCSNFVTALKRNIGVYYYELNKAQIHHSGVYLSANPYKFNGKPIYESESKALLLWSQNNIVADFNWRTDRITGRCNNCRNSPIWAMYRFYQQEPTFSSLWHGEFMNPEVPVDTLVVSERKDQYKYYAQKFPVESKWSPADFAQFYTDYNQKFSKAFRISAVTTACEERESALADEAYRTIVDRTQGKLYAVSGCHIDMAKILKDYAQRVILRAYIHAKKRLPLSKVPRNPQDIRVTLSGIALTDDKWDYDGARNEVVMHWNLINDGQLKPGDKLTIEYFANGIRLSLLQ